MKYTEDGGVKRRLVVFKYMMTFVDKMKDTIGKETYRLGDPKSMSDFKSDKILEQHPLHTNKS